MPKRQPLSGVISELGGDLDTALERLPVPVMICDDRGVVRWQNGRSIDLFGDLRTRPFTDLVAPEASQLVRLETAKKLLGTRRTTSFGAVFRTATGRRVPVEVESSAINDGLRIVGIFRVVTPGEVARSSTYGPHLTPRQYEVLLALARGASTHQIAEQMNISRETVRNHVRHLLAALSAHSRVEAIAEARRRGLIP